MRTPHLPLVPPGTWQLAWRRLAETINQMLSALQVHKWTAPTLEANIEFWGGDFAPPGYYRDITGRVYIRGIVKGTGVKVFATLFTLPEGYRPPYQRGYALNGQDASDAMGVWRIDVHTTGAVVIEQGTTLATDPTSFLFLDGISFDTTA